MTYCVLTRFFERFGLPPDEERLRGEDLSDSVESDVCKLIDKESPSSFEVRLF